MESVYLVYKIVYDRTNKELLEYVAEETRIEDCNEYFKSHNYRVVKAWRKIQ